MEKNAIILAAGKSGSFAPFTYEKPKGLFCVKGEVLIERQIEQLQAAGIRNIYVVIGYMKEKYFYLEQKYGVYLLVNNAFAMKGNLYSLFVAREYMENSYICCADHYFVSNPYLEDNRENLSYRACAYHRGYFNEFAVDYSDIGVITGFQVGGSDKMAMVGHAYFNSNFSRRFRELMETEINGFGVAKMFWEEFYARHQKELTLFVREFAAQDILEFETIDDLRQFDMEFLANIDSGIIKNICGVLKCDPNSIKDIEVIQAGLTNVSFSFRIADRKYVYRHPGGTAGTLVDRYTETYAQKKAFELGLDRSLIYIDQAGWKISYFVENAVPCDFREQRGQLKMAMAYLRQLHNAHIDQDSRMKVFDVVAEGKRLMRIASGVKGDLFVEFADLISKIEKLNSYVQEEAERLNIRKVLCHNDVYEPNFLIAGKHDMYLIDWEYAGIGDPANDLGCILGRADYTDEQIEEYLWEYFGRDLTYEEHRHYIAHIALSAFYWFGWGLYKGSVGDDDGFFFLPAYRNCIRFIDTALHSYDGER